MSDPEGQTPEDDGAELAESLRPLWESRRIDGEKLLESLSKTEVSLEGVRLFVTSPGGGKSAISAHLLEHYWSDAEPTRFARLKRLFGIRPRLSGLDYQKAMLGALGRERQVRALDADLETGTASEISETLSSILAAAANLSSLEVNSEDGFDVPTIPSGLEADLSAVQLNEGLIELFLALGPPPDGTPDDGTWGDDAPPGESEPYDPEMAGLPAPRRGERPGSDPAANG
ncbi:hypothetical protein [Streptomyces sp. NPDC001137]|uniref:hypothetical protein n=1 Tax=Streptomyces sp. NPDC001137 TaxID=3154378 RepID=UPI003319BA93